MFSYQRLPKIVIYALLFILFVYIYLKYFQEKQTVTELAEKFIRSHEFIELKLYLIHDEYSFWLSKKVIPLTEQVQVQKLGRCFHDELMITLVMLA